MPVHIMASAAFPVYFDFRKVPLDYDYDQERNDGLTVGVVFGIFGMGVSLAILLNEDC